MGIFNCVKDPYWKTLPSRNGPYEITPLPDEPTESIQVEIVVIYFFYLITSNCNQIKAHTNKKIVESTICWLTTPTHEIYPGVVDRSNFNPFEKIGFSSLGRYK